MINELTDVVGAISPKLRGAMLERQDAEERAANAQTYRNRTEVQEAARAAEYQGWLTKALAMREQLADPSGKLRKAHDKASAALAAAQQHRAAITLELEQLQASTPTTDKDILSTARRVNEIRNELQTSPIADLEAAAQDAEHEYRKAVRDAARELELSSGKNLRDLVAQQKIDLRAAEVEASRCATLRKRSEEGRL